MPAVLSGKQNSKEAVTVFRVEGEGKGTGISPWLRNGNGDVEVFKPAFGGGWLHWLGTMANIAVCISFKEHNDNVAAIIFAARPATGGPEFTVAFRFANAAAAKQFLEIFPRQHEKPWEVCHIVSACLCMALGVPVRL